MKAEEILDKWTDFYDEDYSKEKSRFLECSFSFTSERYMLAAMKEYAQQFHYPQISEEEITDAQIWDWLDKEKFPILISDEQGYKGYYNLDMPRILRGFIRHFLSRLPQRVELNHFDLVKNKVAIFSDMTFGPERDYTKPLYHLKKEVEETIVSGKIEEYADMLLLFLDSFRKRYPDLGTETLLNCCDEKIEINKKRKWGKPDENGVIEHIREAEQSVGKTNKLEGEQPQEEEKLCMSPGNCIKEDGNCKDCYYYQ